MQSKPKGSICLEYCRISEYESVMMAVMSGFFVCVGVMVMIHKSCQILHEELPTDIVV